MAIAVPNEVPLEEEKGNSGRIERTLDQEKARIERAKEYRQTGDVSKEERSVKAVQQAKEENTFLMAQQRVQALRAARNSQSVESQQKSVVDYIGYLPAFAIALCKDLLDFVAIGSIPVIGLIVTFIASVLIGICLFFTDSNLSSGTSKKILMRIGVLTGVTLVEGIAFGINFFPLETAAVALILLADLGAARRAAKILQYIPAGRISKVVVK